MENIFKANNVVSKNTSKFFNIVLLLELNYLIKKTINYYKLLSRTRSERIFPAKN